MLLGKLRMPSAVEKDISIEQLEIDAVFAKKKPMCNVCLKDAEEVGKLFARGRREMAKLDKAVATRTTNQAKKATGGAAPTDGTKAGATPSTTAVYALMKLLDKTMTEGNAKVVLQAA